MKANAKARAVTRHTESAPAVRPSGARPHVMSAAFARDFSQVRVRGDGRPVVRRYVAYGVTEQTTGTSNGWRHPYWLPLRVADNGEAAVEDRGWNPNSNKRAWSTPARIAAANGRLAAQRSAVTLRQKSGGHPVSGWVPGSPNIHHLVEIEPKKPNGDPIMLASDCGTAAREVMGSGGGRDVAALNRGNREEYLTPRTYHGGARTTPEEWSEELFRKEFGAGLSRTQAYARYAALSPTDRDAFDQKYGINTYARPRVGQGLTVSTEGDMPGFAVHPGMENNTWNFHYAATVLDSGQDYVTLENAAGWPPTAWIFYMYGPRSRGQTFHEEHGRMLSHGNRFTTFVVQPENTLYVRSRVNARLVHASGAFETLPPNTQLRVVERLVDLFGRPYYQVEDIFGQRGTIWPAEVQ